MRRHRSEQRKPPKAYETRRDQIESSPKPDREELNLRRTLMYQLISIGLTQRQIIETMANPKELGKDSKFYNLEPCTDIQTVHLMNAVRAEIKTERELMSSTTRAVQLERLYNDVSKMRTLPEVPWTQVRMTEALIADIEGNNSPIEVVHTNEIGEHLARAISAMTPEQRAAAIAEQRQVNQLAEHGRRVIETTGEASSDRSG